MDVIHTYLKRFLNCNVVLEPSSQKGFEPRLKVDINSLENKKFKQPMRMLSMHSRAQFFFFYFLGFGVGRIFFFLFCSQCGILVFRSCSLRVPPPPMRSSGRSQQHLNFIHEQGDLLSFILITSLITLISAPKHANVVSKTLATIFHLIPVSKSWDICLFV